MDAVIRSLSHRGSVLSSVPFLGPHGDIFSRVWNRLIFGDC